MNISKRLEMIADCVSPNYILADIGTDHAYIPIKLILDKKIKKALAMDIAKGPLDKAKKNIKLYGLENSIETRLSNGLEKLFANEVDTVLIAGMGGDLIKEILEIGKDKLIGVKELVLSPHLHIEIVRKYLYDNNFTIINENIVYEDNKYYIVLKAIPKKDAYLDNATAKECYKYYKYGRYLFTSNNDLFKKYLENELNISNKLLYNLEKNKDNDNVIKRIDTIKNDIDIIKEYINEM